MKKKGNIRIVLGYILIVFQLMGLLGSYRTEGTIIPAGQGGVYSIGFLIGYFLPAIIGIILLSSGYKAKNKAKNENENENNF